MTAQEWGISVIVLSRGTPGKYHRWSSGWEDLYNAGNNRVAQILARTQHTDANIIKVFHSTQIQRDKRISWQLLSPYLCLGANFFIFQSAMQIISHFIPTIIIQFWTMLVSKGFRFASVLSRRNIGKRMNGWDHTVPQEEIKQNTHNTIVVLNSEMLIKKHQGTFKNAR